MNRKLFIYNTPAGRKEEFKPLLPGKVGMYACGVTVYDSCHIGHARSAITFDVICRYLEHLGYRVTYVRNFTDIDDKIINRAKNEEKRWDEIADFYIKDYSEDMTALGIRKPDIEPKATEHIADIINIIKGLVEKGHAYARGGDVFFSIKSFPAYGKFSGRSIDDLQAGARVTPDEKKDDPLDFALWKASKEGEPSWESPWGGGRPGWHIECSAMSIRHLSETFDIHGGGKDLIFPHHENEIAQSEGFTGKRFVNYWIHNGFVTVDEEKMSKSLGNFFTIKEILKVMPFDKTITAEVMRYFLLSTHYRSPVNFSEKNLTDAKYALDGFYSLKQRIKEKKFAQENKEEKKNAGIDFASYKGKIEEVMCDDFNTAEALGQLNKLRAEMNKGFETLTEEDIESFNTIISDCSSFLGILGKQVEKWSFSSSASSSVSSDNWEFPDFLQIKLKEKWEMVGIDEKEQMLIETRTECRASKDWGTADKIRTYLNEHGIILEDKSGGGTRLKR